MAEEKAANSVRKRGRCCIRVIDKATVPREGMIEDLEGLRWSRGNGILEAGTAWLVRKVG